VVAVFTRGAFAMKRAALAACRHVYLRRLAVIPAPACNPPWHLRPSCVLTCAASARSRPTEAPRSPVRASTHGFQQFAGNAVWRREAGTASRSRARRHAVAGVATLSAAQHRAGAVSADNDASRGSARALGARRNRSVL
jgi:hypothetical protein